MKLGREQMDDGAALEELFASLPVSADWTVGFLAGVSTGPDTIASEAWIPEVAPDQNASSRAKVELLERLYGAAVETLRTTPEIICPEPDKPTEEASEFCSGYLRGARMHAKWRDDEVATKKLLPFEVLAEGKREVFIDGERITDIDGWIATQRERLGSYVAELYAYWQSKRQVVNAAGKVGRNDPCPCGSGKKHKKCCLDKG
jgi:uncharacterized protein